MFDLSESAGQTLERTVRNTLATNVAEFTYAQILDGLPTGSSFRNSRAFVKDHPVHVMQHLGLCPGSLNRAREFRNQFDFAKLKFQFRPLIDFQPAAPDSEEYKLRLAELVVVACPQIGAYLFELDDGAHKHQVYQDWVDKVLEEK
ncbi:hypothetical protein QQX98_005353 [Neonectria punicea]|uniref:Uncharacterized protein n=1 Tax=Neonectria punicea TaxID=979145 RepID=A0ABR1H528_9HYPO